MEVWEVMSDHFPEPMLYCHRANAVGVTVGLSEKRPP